MTKLDDTWKQELSAYVRDVMREAVLTAVGSEFTTDVVDAWLQEYLKGRCCYLSFNEGKPEILLGLGHGDVAEVFTPELMLDDYGMLKGLETPMQVDDIRQQIKGIKAFVAQLEDALRHLESRIATFKERK